MFFAPPNETLLKKIRHKMVENKMKALMARFFSEKKNPFFFKPSYQNEEKCFWSKNLAIDVFYKGLSNRWIEFKI